MKHSLVLRRYQKKDCEQLARLFHNTIHKICSRDYSKEQLDAWAPSDWEDEDWQKRCARLNPHIAVFDGLVVGFAEFESSGYINRFYVHHDYQGQGIATALLKEIEKEAASLCISKIYADVSITAKPFFSAKGFQVVKKQTVQLRGQEFTNYLMEKILPL